jgi:filamentous hemagglutinin
MADQAQAALAHGNYGLAAALGVGSLVDAGMGVLTGGESKVIAGAEKAGAEILPDMTRPIRTPNPDFPPNQSIVDAMNGPAMQKMVANGDCVDCSDIAGYLYDVSGGKGQVLEVTPATRNNLNVYENGRLEEGQSYHQVYTDGQYVYDPQFLCSQYQKVIGCN